jgi:hypothetical protein
MSLDPLHGHGEGQINKQHSIHVPVRPFDDWCTGFQPGSAPVLSGLLLQSGHCVNGVTLGEQLLPSWDERYYRMNTCSRICGTERFMLDGQAITLTRMEYRLVALLLDQAGEMVP